MHVAVIETCIKEHIIVYPCMQYLLASFLGFPAFQHNVKKAGKPTVSERKSNILLQAFCSVCLVHFAH